MWSEEAYSVLAEKHYINLHKVGKVLIVGGRSTNFPRRYRENPRFIFWESTQASTLRRAKIPTGVTHIIISRFVPHKLIFRLMKVLPPETRLINVIEGTGRINEFLEAVAS